jgi:hypothetical protein
MQKEITGSLGITVVVADRGGSQRTLSYKVINKSLWFVQGVSKIERRPSERIS